MKLTERKETLKNYKGTSRKCNQKREQVERNKTIYLEYLNGKSIAKIAKENNISYIRVKQITGIMERKINWEHWKKENL